MTSESVTWNPVRGHFDWSVTRSDGKTFTGYADTETQARHDAQTDWRVRGEQPRYVLRTARGVQPPSSLR